jgi:hypothetical protein
MFSVSELVWPNFMLSVSGAVLLRVLLSVSRLVWPSVMLSVSGAVWLRVLLSVSRLVRPSVMLSVRGKWVKFYDFCKWEVDLSLCSL